MLLITLTNGDKIPATRFTPTNDLVEIISEAGNRMVISRNDVESIGETEPPSVSTHTVYESLAKQRPDLLLLARQALNLSSFFMDRLIHDEEYSNQRWSETSLHMDAESICGYFDKR